MVIDSGRGTEEPERHTGDEKTAERAERTRQRYNTAPHFAAKLFRYGNIEIIFIDINIRV